MLTSIILCWHDWDMRNPDELFGLEVQAQREDKGWSMTEFASMLSEAGLKNFHPTTIGRLERGERPVRLNEAVVIAKVLGSALDDLVVEPLPGDDALKFATNSVESSSKRAARAFDVVKFWRREVEKEVTELRRKLADGTLLSEHVDAAEESCRRGEEILASDRLQHWVTVLEQLDAEERQALYKSDPEFKL